MFAVSYTHLDVYKRQVATCPLSGMQEIAMAVFTAIVQGILVAGLSTYVNQVIKQHNKEE